MPDTLLFRMPPSLQPSLSLQKFARRLSQLASQVTTTEASLTSMDPSLRSHYLADNPPTVVQLEIAPHFAALSPKQKRYAHHLSRASFLGTRVTLAQVSPESAIIYDLILALHRACSGDYEKLSNATSVPSSDITLWLEYSAQFLGNCGNYKGFGDSKFIPRLQPETLEKLCMVNDECKKLHDTAMKTGGGIYETKDVALMHFGYPEAGHMTTYYPDSPTITKEEISTVGDVLEEKKLLIENTRLRKLDSGDFELLIASGIQNPPAAERDLGDVSTIDLPGKLSGKKLHLVFGDYLNEMAKIAVEIKKARKEAANDTEEKMLNEYARSFGTGSIQGFVESQRYWIKNKKPVVETDLGFVETYRDPHGVRGEWEGFVAMVNQERTRAFGKLVDAAPSMIPKLPWGKEFEKDKFLSPDFTSLEVLSFAGSGIPAGINIPNYDFIRQNEGFKNVSLGNVLSAKAPKEPIPFIRKEDDELYRRYRDGAFEVQVGIHELLGHGCGKLLQETAPGEYNFDVENPPTSPVSKQPVTSWYKPGQTWSSVFGSIASSYEECRAECVAMALSCDFELLEIFGFGNGKGDMSNEAGDVLYVAYLQMARAGVAALEYWDPKARKWGQIHMQARFAILRTFMEAGGNFCEIKAPNGDVSNPNDLEIFLDRSKILSHGRPAVEDLLQKLHIYKATADFDAGKKLYDDITSVDEWWAEKARPIVLNKKTPRKVFVQANTVLDAETGEVKLFEYEPTLQGMVQSYFERDV